MTIASTRTPGRHFWASTRAQTGGVLASVYVFYKSFCLKHRHVGQPPLRGTVALAVHSQHATGCNAARDQDAIACACILSTPGPPLGICSLGPWRFSTRAKGGQPAV
jgi:hypothetical protein